MVKKFYYFVEDLDITSDNIPDGVLVRQFLIDTKTNYFTYTKNNYLSQPMLEKIIQDVQDSTNKSDVKSLLVSKKTLNAIKNKKIDIDLIPRVIISKTSVFSHLLHRKPIDINNLINNMNKLFS